VATAARATGHGGNEPGERVMTRHGLFIHVAASHQRRPTRWFAPSGVAITLSLENPLGDPAKISAITPVDAYFNALGPTESAVIDCP
jgi:hypothetical protein